MLPQKPHQKTGARPPRLRDSLLRQAARMKPVGLLAASLALAPSLAQAEFIIQMDWGSHITESQKTYFTDAANKWMSYISGYSDGVSLNGIVLSADIDAIDGESGVLGHASPVDLVRKGSKVYAVTGDMLFDSADVANMIADGSFTNVVLHEMAHAIGIGSIWTNNGLYVDGTGKYTGKYAIAAWNDEFGQNSTFVPVELEGGGGTAGGHWDEVGGGAGDTGFVSKYTGKDFSEELMTGWSSSGSEFISTVTLNAFRDLGYDLGVPQNAQGDYILTSGVYYGLMTGPRAVYKTTTGTATIMSDNDFTRGAYLLDGTTVVASARALGAGELFIYDGAALDVRNTNLTGLTKLTLVDGTIIGNSGSVSVSGSYELYKGVVSASLGGVASLQKTTPDTVTLTAANTYTGGTRVIDGTLVVQNNRALGGGRVVVAGGMLDVGATNLILDADLRVESGVLKGAEGSISASSYSLVGGTTSVSLAGSAALVKSGADIATLSGANTYSGGTTLNAGTLRLANARALASGPVLVNAGILDVGDTAVVGVSELILNGGQITGGKGSLSADRFILNYGTVSAALAGAGSALKTGDDTVTVSGANTFTGGLVVEAGTLVATGESSLGAGAVSTTGGSILIKSVKAASLATISLDGGAVRFDDTLTAAEIGGLAGVSGIRLNNTADQPFALTVGTNNAASASYAGIFSGTGTLSKGGTGRLTLAGASTHTGGTRVLGGVLVLGGAQAAGAGDIAVLGGTLDVAGLSITGLRTLLVDGGALAEGTGSIAATRFDLRSGVVATSLTGVGSVEKTGEGSLELSVANTYFGGTTVREGTLVVSHYQALGTGGLTVVGGTLDAEAGISGLSSFTLKGGVVNGLIGSVSAASFDLQNGRIEVKLSGSAPVRKTTDGVVTLTAANSITGAVEVGAGRLVITNPFALGKGLTTVKSGAVLQLGDDSVFTAPWSGQDLKLESDATLEVRLASNTTISRKLFGDGGVTINGTGTITLANATYTGDTAVNRGTLVVKASSFPTGKLITQGEGTLNIDVTGANFDASRNITGDGRLAFTGAGDATLHGALKHDGEILVDSGATLHLGASDTERVDLNNTALRVGLTGRLVGNGSIKGKLVNAGVVAPGNSPGTITLTGDFVNTGTLRMEIKSDGTHDQIRYAGQAVLSGNLEIVHLGTPPKGTVVNFLVDTYTVDNVASVVGKFATVTTPSGGGVAYATANGVNYVVGGTLFSVPGASSPNAARLGDFANALVAAGSSNTQIAALTSTFTNTGAALAHTVTSASPLGLASATALPLKQSQDDNDQLYRHLTARRFERGQAWLLEYSPYAYINGSRATAGADKDGQAFDHNSVGASVGADIEPSPDLTLGAKVGYDSGKADFHRGGGKLTQDRLRLTFYGSQLLENRYFVDAAVFAGYSLYDVKRNTVLGAETGDTSGWDAGMFVNTGFVTPLTSKTSLTPHVGVSLSRAQVDAFREKGTALALDVDGYDQLSLASRIGTGLNHVTKVGGLRVRLALDASWVHEFLDNEVDIGGSVAGSGFTTSAVATVKDRLEVGPELDLGVSDNASVSLAYKYDYAFGDATSHRIDIGYRTRF